MSPQLILSLWRERWGKPAAHAAGSPYLEGVLHAWGKNVVASGFWTFPFTSALTAVFCFLLFLLAFTNVLPQGSQIAFSGFLLGWALFARRFNGAFFALLVVSLSVLVSLRYFYWRFTASLGVSLDLDLVLGLVLCLAEIHLWVLTLLSYTPSLLPITQASLSLPDDTTLWPTVDVFIACNDQPHEQVVQAVGAVQAMDWPHKKCHIYLLDRLMQEGFKELAVKLEVLYVACPVQVQDLPGQVNHALQESHGKLIAMIDSGDRLDKNLFLGCIGWFVHEKELAMLQTPEHFLAPKPSSQALGLCGNAASLGSFVLLRRSALVEAGGLPIESASAHAHLALTFQELGYRQSYVGLKPNVNGGAASAQGEAADDFLQKIYRLRSPFLGQSLQWKLRLASFEAATRFYYPLSRWVFFLAPVAYFLGRIPLVHASTWDLTTYALPHLVHMHLATERIKNPRRTTLPLLVRETLLAWYILMCTCLCMVRTGVVKGFESLRSGKHLKKNAFNELTSLPYLALFGLNVLSLYVGLRQGLTSGFDWHEVSSIFALWSIYWILIFTAMLAVAQEAWQIQTHRFEQLRVPVMVKLPKGQSIYCVTENFPQHRLVMVLPKLISIEVGALIQVSIFRGIREAVFSAEVLSLAATHLTVRIEENEQNEYRDLALATQSRGENWPKWLPDRDADHPLPRWLTQFSRTFLYKILDGIDSLFTKWKLKK